ncbi:hypothetical protein Tco_1558970, partial [Tanacetum coccineum]
HTFSAKDKKLERAEAGTSSGSSSVLHDVNKGLKNIQVTDKVCDHEHGDDEHEHHEEGFLDLFLAHFFLFKDQLDKDKLKLKSLLVFWNFCLILAFSALFSRIAANLAQEEDLRSSGNFLCLIHVSILCVVNR